MAAATAAMDFCTLGMFIIDDIYPSPSGADQTPQLNVIGGAGTYSAIGARLFSPPPQSHSVGWIVDAGDDFPPSLTSTIAAWQTGVVVRARAGPTTRGWNGYSGNERRAFKYLSEKKRLTGSDLTPALLAAKSFHLICSPVRCKEQVTSILGRRDSADPPVWIWEPVPDLCVPGELENTLEALKYVDVVSPNHQELAALFSYEHPHERVAKATVENHAQQLLDHGIGPDGKGAVIVRVGAEGCFVLSRSVRRWLPAYHTDAKNVKDPTGGGNGFLGGLAVGLVRTNFDLVESASWASVAASLCIEQVGVPQLDTNANPETWNGISVLDRWEEFRARTVET